MSSIHSIGIVGYGRFGRLFDQLLQDKAPSLERMHYDPTDTTGSAPLADVCACSVVILAVPIGVLQETLVSIKDHVSSETTILDVCSVKLHPKSMMESILPQHCSIVCTHPLFGPATYLKRNKDLTGLKVVLECVRAQENTYQDIVELFQSFGVTPVEMSADEHDRLTARFQFTALTTGLLLKNLDLGRSKIDTGSATVMMDFVEMISIDKQLLLDMYRYNPYCKQKWKELERSFLDLQEELERISS